MKCEAKKSMEQKEKYNRPMETHGTERISKKFKESIRLKYGRTKHFLSIFLLFGFVGFGLLLSANINEYREGSEEYRELNYILWKDPTKFEENVDHRQTVLFEDRLKQINSDYIFWLSIPGTSINYPVVKSVRPGYYLNHTFQGTENPCGSLFVQGEEKQINKENTVIFGHNMKNGSMFSDLKYYKNKDFYEKHKLIHIYYQGKRYEGVVFSCQIRAEEDLECYQTEFSSPVQKHEFINNMKAHSLYNIPVSLGEQTSVITLSTCHGDRERMIVQAALVCYTE